MAPTGGHFTVTMGAIDRRECDGGMSHVGFKKTHCRCIEFKKLPCRPVELKIS